MSNRLHLFAVLSALLLPMPALAQSPAASTGQPVSTSAQGEAPQVSVKTGEIPYSDVVHMARAGQLREILVRSQNGPFPLLLITTKDGAQLESRMPTLRLDDRILDTGTVIRADNGSAVERASSWLASALWVVMMLSSIMLVVFLFKQQGRGKINKFKPGKISSGKGSARLSSVGGQEEAKRELMEVIEFLREPAAFTALGAKVPRGILLEGEPGNGKTMLARAIAEEAGVPFFHLDASGLVEMFAGLGPKRVRSAFALCRKHAPCIMFIDELDSVGKVRGQGAMGAQNEYDSILNQMLVEMDGIASAKAGKEVIVIAATNRADMLDPALMRPGRLTRRIIISRPTLMERMDIIRLHARDIPIEGEDTLAEAARMTSGCSGAETANLVNEAAISAARHKRVQVTLGDFIEARDRFLVGLVRPSGIMNEYERRVSAVHEAGHAVAILMTEDADPIDRASIQPRGHSLGSVISVPERDNLLTSKKTLMGRLRLCMGGRAAEMITFGEGAVTSGAREDLRIATLIATEMIAHLGMGNRLGFMATQVEAGLRSPEQMGMLEAEVQELLNRSMTDMLHVLDEARDLHGRIVERLLRDEVVSGADLRRMRDERPTSIRPL